MFPYNEEVWRPREGGPQGFQVDKAGGNYQGLGREVQQWSETALWLLWAHAWVNRLIEKLRCQPKRWSQATGEGELEYFSITEMEIGWE